MEIKPFSEENLAEALSSPYTDPETIKAKRHFRYFVEYLNYFHVQYLIIEKDYINRDFLHDNASYYALCFKDYPKFCKRIHFFNTTLTSEMLDRAILGKLESPVNIWDFYLGFIVAKPIPTTVIGFTVLKNYSNADHDGHRNFWGLRKYTVHIFGHKHTLLSLAFQEQDTVLAACATTAIWTMLNKAAVDYHTMLKTPNQITQDADTISWDGSRLFPNKGLDVAQICQSIFNSGLVTEVRQPKFNPEIDEEDDINNYLPNSYTKKLINAYSGLGIPLILVIEVPNEGEIGLHAVAVLGSKELPLEAVAEGPDIRWRADNIEKIYAHDDQYGPFVRIIFKNEFDLDTEWTHDDRDRNPTKATSMVIPVFPKVRISYDYIESIVRGLDTILREFFSGRFRYGYLWDIKIQLSEDFKTAVRQWPLPDENKLRLLKSSLPKYLWIATCYVGEDQLFVFTFDATDVSTGMIGQDVICFSETAGKMFRDSLIASKSAVLKAFINKAKIEYYKFLLDKLA